VSSTQRNTTRRDRDRAYIRRTQPPCGICGQPIDYTLPHLDPQSYVVDHITPLNKGGLDTRDNKQAAHRSCNRTKSDTTADDLAPRTYETWRRW
jgi:5-methylcytosine-specific restriction endonuclease McrA